MRTRERRGSGVRSGFTLVEMLVASVLVAIGVVGALTAFSVETRATAKAERLSTAVMLARQQIAQVALQGTAQSLTATSGAAGGLGATGSLGTSTGAASGTGGGGITGGSQEGDFSPDHPEYRWRQSIDATDYQYLYKVTVTVMWGSPQSPDEHTVTTYLIDQYSEQAAVQASSSGATQ